MKPPYQVQIVCAGPAPARGVYVSETHESLNAATREAAARDSRDAARCNKRVKPTPLPPSFPIESARSHPRFKHYLEPGAQCEHKAGHDGPHRNGGLIWHEPPALYVGGERIW